MAYVVMAYIVMAYIVMAIPVVMTNTLPSYQSLVLTPLGEPAC